MEAAKNNGENAIERKEIKNGNTHAGVPEENEKKKFECITPARSSSLVINVYESWFSASGSKC